MTEHPGPTTPRGVGQAARPATPAYAVAPGFTGSRKPGAVLAAQIMVGISVTSNVLVLVACIIALFPIGPLGRPLAFPRGTRGVTPSVAIVGILGFVALLIITIVKFNAQRGIGRRQRSSRTVLTVLPGLEAVALLIFSLLAGTGVLAALFLVVLGLPWPAVIVLLLRAPAPAQQWFDHSGPASYRLGRPRQPLDRADDGDLWAAKRQQARQRRPMSRPVPPARPTVAEAVATRPTSASPVPSDRGRPTEDEKQADQTPDA